MDESILVPNAESFFAGSVLIPMGIKINKPVVLARLNEVIDEFNETYLETIDFLTQILPLAREQFGRSDNLLLPKTPSKKRHRKVIRDRSNQENIDPNIPPKASAEESSPVKRTTRSSRRNNPAPSQDEPTKKRNSKGRAKKSEQLKVAFVSESKVVIEVKLPAKVCTLKRTSSTSPVSIKPVKKKSKSSDELSLLDEDSLLKKQTSTPVNAEPLQMLSLSSIVDHSDTKPDANELVNVVEKDETNLLKSYELKAVKMDIDIKEKNEPPTGILVEIENNNEEKGGVILVLDSPPPVIKIPLVKVEPPTSILININETPPATNENVDKITNEAVAESAVINKIPGKIVNETIVKETPDKITNKVVVNEFPAKNGLDEQLNSESVVQPIGRDLGSPVQQLRRSKRLSEQINAAELAAEPLLKQKKQVDKPISVEEPTSDSQDDAPAQIVILVTPESKPVRRSTRRISKVSTGYKRRSSRRSSHQPGYFRKPVTLKQIEVHLNDVGINEVVIDEVVIKPEPSATPELHKAVFLGSEHSSAESEDDAPKMFSSIPRSNIPHQSAKTDSSGDEPAEGTVAGIIQKINKKTLQNEQTSSFKTPNGIRKIKIGSAVQGSSHQNPPNVVGGSVKSFIERQSVKKLDANEIARQKKLDSQRKEEKDRERKDRAELSRKNWADQRKRKREEIQKRVAEAKATRAREEQDKKERQLEDERQMVYASKKARKKKEHEEETKKRLREQRTKEAEARRLKDNIERLERLQVREEDCKMYQEMLKRKQEQEEHDRKQRIQDEKRAHGQKQRERAREKEEERERLLREIKEREAKKLEKEEAKRKEKEEKERKQREQDERQNKRIAQLIKDKMDQDKKLREEKLREENERKLRDEQRRREEQRAAMLEAARTADSYLMTPPPAQTRKPATSENYDISDIRSDESTDDEDDPRKIVPYWAQGAALKSALLQQEEAQRMFEELTSGFVPHAPDLEKIFTKKRKRFYQRTSSAHWNSPPLKV